MRRRLAAILRGWAQRLDPQPSIQQVEITEGHLFIDGVEHPMLPARQTFPLVGRVVDWHPNDDGTVVYFDRPWRA